MRLLYLIFLRLLNLLPLLGHSSASKDVELLVLRHKADLEQRREWWRGDPPGELTCYILDEVIVPGRDEYPKAPPPQYRYFEDEVKRARKISDEWSVCLLHGMDYEEILAWRRRATSNFHSWWSVHRLSGWPCEHPGKGSSTPERLAPTR